MNFNDAKKVYQKRKEAVSSIFEDVGDIAAQTFVAEVKKETTAQKLVKTGNYRRSWTADVNKDGINTEIKCINEAEYASHLEYGHRIVTRAGRDTGRKTKGRFVGLISMTKTQTRIRPELTNLLRKVLDE